MVSIILIPRRPSIQRPMRKELHFTGQILGFSRCINDELLDFQIKAGSPDRFETILKDCPDMHRAQFAKNLPSRESFSAEHLVPDCPPPLRPFAVHVRSHLTSCQRLFDCFASPLQFVHHPVL